MCFLLLDVFITGFIHRSRTWVSGSFTFMRRNAGMLRLDFGSFSHPKDCREWCQNLFYIQGKYITSIGWLWGLNMWCWFMQDRELSTLPTELFWPSHEDACETVVCAHRGWEKFTHSIFSLPSGAYGNSKGLPFIVSAAPLRDVSRINSHCVSVPNP